MAEISTYWHLELTETDRRTDGQKESSTGSAAPPKKSELRVKKLGGKQVYPKLF